MMQPAQHYANKVMDDLREGEIRDPDTMKEVIQKRIKEAMYAALFDYAWMKDGVSYVGSGIRTLQEAEAKL